LGNDIHLLNDPIIASGGVNSCFAGGDAQQQVDDFYYFKIYATDADDIQWMTNE